MRNAGTALLILLLSALLALLAACSNPRCVVVRLPDALPGTPSSQVDSIDFRQNHHYWCGYKFCTREALYLSPQPTDYAYFAPVLLPADREIAAVDINILPSPSPQTADSVVWIFVVDCSECPTSMGWIKESDLLSAARPTHWLANVLSVFTSIGFVDSWADVPGGRYSHDWLEFYFNPTLNPWTQPPHIALLVIVLWLLPVLLLAAIDYYFIHRERYRCGHCHGPLRRLGRCPHCGAMNTK